MFKKIIYLSFAIFLLMFMWSINSSTEKLKSSGNGKVYLYSSSSNCIISNSDKIPFFKKGESYQLKNYQDVEKILNFYNADVKIVEQIEEGTNYYAFSNKLKYGKVVNGKLINLHIFMGKDKIVIGAPIIYGSY